MIELPCNHIQSNKVFIEYVEGDLFISIDDRNVFLNKANAKKLEEFLVYCRVRQEICQESNQP